ncbi:MAG: hypothetical protein ACLT98_16955 [Eggerthellaceae bacterium]
MLDVCAAAPDIASDGDFRWRALRGVCRTRTTASGAADMVACASDVRHRRSWGVCAAEG